MGGENVAKGNSQSESNVGNGRPQTPGNIGTGTLKPLRTYQGDVSDVIGKTKVSAVTIAVAEQKRKIKTEPEPTRNPAARNKFFMMAGASLIIFGILAVGIFYYLSLQNKITPALTTAGAILNYDQEFDIVAASSTRADLIQKISAEEKNFNLPANSVLYLNTTDGNLPAISQTVLAVLSPQIPSALLLYTLISSLNQVLTGI